MNFLKIKLGIFSLLAIFAVSIFLTSCEQENLVKDKLPDELQETMKKIAQDADVNEFINASFEFNKALRERIEANQEQFDAFSLTNDEEKISELLKNDEISDLYEKLVVAASTALAKYPQLNEIDENAIEKFHLNNPQLTENLSEGLESRFGSESCKTDSFLDYIRYLICLYNVKFYYLDTKIPPDRAGFSVGVWQCKRHWCKNVPMHP